MKTADVLSLVAGKIKVSTATAAQVMMILSKVVDFIILVESFGATLSGNQKYEAVMAMVQTYLKQLKLDKVADEIMDDISWAVSFIVKVFNFLKLWPLQVPTAPAAPQHQ